MRLPRCLTTHDWQFVAAGESIGGIVPARDNTATTLTAEVKPDDNTFDFELQSD